MISLTSSLIGYGSIIWRYFYHFTSAALKHLNDIAENHSKSIKIKKKKLKCENYLKDYRFSKDEVQLLFKLRTRMFPVKTNFRSKYKLNLACEFCSIGTSDQEHQLSCPVIRNFLPDIVDSNVRYQDLFGNTEKQLQFIKIYTKIARQREVLLESLNM